MKIILVTFVFCTIFLATPCFAASDNEIKPIDEIRKTTKVLTVNDNITRNDEGQKVLILKFSSLTDNRDHSNYNMRVTVEVKDKDGNLYCGQTIRKKKNVVYHYADNDWVFETFLGDLEKPKLTAYAVEFGVLKKGKFTPLNSKFKKVESAAEILQRSKKQLTVTCTFQD